MTRRRITELFENKQMAAQSLHKLQNYNIITCIYIYIFVFVWLYIIIILVPLPSSSLQEHPTHTDWPVQRRLPDGKGWEGLYTLLCFCNYIIKVILANNINSPMAQRHKIRTNIIAPGWTLVICLSNDFSGG